MTLHRTSSKTIRNNIGERIHPYRIPISHEIWYLILPKCNMRHLKLMYCAWTKLISFVCIPLRSSANQSTITSCTFAQNSLNCSMMISKVLMWSIHDLPDVNPAWALRRELSTYSLNQFSSVHSHGYAQ